MQNNKKMISTVLAVILAVTLVSCGEKATEEPASEVTQKSETVMNAEEGGNVVMPEGFVLPESANTMAVVVNEGGGMAGSFLQINYRTTDYFTTTGSLTLSVNASMFSLQNDTYAPQETQYPQARAALWKRGENTGVYVKTAEFNADGKTYTATFSDLDPAAQYRITFTYSEVPRYKMTGNFNLAGVVSAGAVAEDTEGKDAKAKDAKK